MSKNPKLRAEGDVLDSSKATETVEGDRDR